MQTQCQVCGYTGILQKCGKCLCAYYCGANCQRQDWPKHREVCDRGNRQAVKFLRDAGKNRLVLSIVVFFWLRYKQTFFIREHQGGYVLYSLGPGDRCKLSYVTEDGVVHSLCLEHPSATKTKIPSSLLDQVVQGKRELYVTETGKVTLYA